MDLGRLSDQQFAALLPETDTTGAVILAERLRRKPLPTWGIAIGVGVDRSHRFASGYPVARMTRPSWMTCCARAEEALNAAKRDGSNRVAVATWNGVGQAPQTEGKELRVAPMAQHALIEEQQLAERASAHA